MFGGPLVLLDKSALKAMSAPACRELGRYFFTVVAPVMLLEILADLKHEKGSDEENRQRVQGLLKKIPQIDMAVSPSFNLLCLNEIAGGGMRRPADGVRRVPRWTHTVSTARGKVGVSDESPERAAFFRWYCGDVSAGEQILAADWRRVTKRIDLEGFRRRFRGLDKHFRTISDVDIAVRAMLADEASQLPVFEVLLTSAGAPKGLMQSLRSQWRIVAGMNPARFWWYGMHCARVLLTLSASVAGGVIGTRATNRIDAEYFYYTPFVNVFVSGDAKSHGILQEALLDKDQTYVDAVSFRNALQELAERRAAVIADGKPSNGPELDPQPGTLIHDLHLKHRGVFKARPAASGPPFPSDVTPGRLRELFEEADRIVKAHPAKYPQPPRWPV